MRNRYPPWVSRVAEDPVFDETVSNLLCRPERAEWLRWSHWLHSSLVTASFAPGDSCRERAHALAPGLRGRRSPL